jgi:DNA-binding transcriptional MerR regulator
MTRWLSVSDFAKESGLSKPTIRNMCATGKLEHSSSGNRIYIKQIDEVEQLITLQELNDKLNKIAAHLGVKV